MKSSDRSWDLDEFIGLVVFGVPTAVYCYWIGYALFQIIHICVNLI
jgi:hypothetical protein